MQGFTEVVCKRQPEEDNCRPDGLLVLKTPKSTWNALIEAKIGGARIEPRQLGRYCELAKLNKLDAIITLSNEYTPVPTHLPYQVPAQLRGKIELIHWSWTWKRLKEGPRR